MRYNKTLLLSSALLAALLFVVIYPGSISPQNPYALSLIKFWLGDNGALQIATAPYAPGPDHLIGSDQLGRDLLSFLAYGTRLTLGLALGIMLGRMALAIPLGIWAGMGSSIATRLIDRFNLVLTTIPPLLIAIIILRIDLFASLYKAQSVAIFIVTLSLLGWSKLAAVVHKSTEQMMSETFILSEMAIGKSKLQLVTQHLLPHLLPELVILAVMEIAAGLTLLMQLGIFSIFIGNLKIIKDSSSGGYSYFNVSFEPEWSSLLGSARDYIRVAPWIALSAGFMFFYTVLSFNLLGEGLRQHYQRLKANPGKNRRLSLKKALPWAIAGLLIVSISLWPKEARFEKVYGEEAFQAQTTQALLSQIQRSLESEGMAPLSEAGYIQNFDRPATFKVRSASLKIADVPIASDTFQVLAGKPLSAFGNLIDGTSLVYSQTDLTGSWLWVDTQLISYQQLINCIPDLKNRGASGIVISDQLTSNGSLAADLPILQLPKDSLGVGSSWQLELSGEIFKTEGKNFAATIKGSEPTLAHNQVILLMDYHSLEPEASQQKLHLYFNLIHQLSNERNQLKRSISVILTDGSEGLDYYAQHGLIQNKNVNVVLDLRALSGEPFKEISFSDSLSPISRYYGYVFAKQFKDQAKPLLASRPADISPDNAVLYSSNGLTTLVFNSVPGEKSSDVLVQLLVKVILTNGR